MQRNRKGFSYDYPVEKIRKYMCLSAKEKLNWLEEINRFTYKAMPNDRKAAWQKLRRGEV